MLRRQQLQKEALLAMEKVVLTSTTANRKDTLACVYALAGDFVRARKYEEEAKDQSGDPAFEKRLAKFTQQPPKDCTGEE